MRNLNFSATAMMVLFVWAANADAQIADVSVALVVQGAPAAIDTAATLPTSGSGFALGDSVYVGVWARTQNPNGLSQVSTDIIFDPNQVAVLSITHTTAFSLFSNGTIDNVAGLVNDLSGSVAPTSPPCLPPVGFSGWARVAEVEMVVIGSAAGTVQSSASGSPIFVVADCGGFGAPQVEYLGVDLNTVDLAQIELVALDSPSASDSAAVLPTSQTKFKVGNTFVVEMWGQTTSDRGFSQVSADIGFDASIVSAVNIAQSATFSLFTNGTINNAVGLLDDVSGSVPSVSPPCSTSIGFGTWARVAIIEMSADSVGPFSMVLSGSGSPIFVIADCGSFVMPAASYQGVGGEAVACFVDGDCDDNNICTVDTCDSFNTCQFVGTVVPVICDDNDPCTGNDQCQGDPAGTCAGSDADGDGDGVPDACDPCPLDNPDDTDGDTVCDSDDVCAGGNDLVDTDGDLVPDDCDNCALSNPDQADCQPNGVGDVCDIDASTSPDLNGNGVPDECEIQPPVVLGGEPGFNKDRYVSFDPTTNGTSAVAIRVIRVGSTTAKFADCTTLEDLGADGFYAELLDGPLPAPPNTTYYCDLSGITSGLHMRGCSVVPGNLYDVAMTTDGIAFSVALSIPTTPPQISATRQFGDTVGSFIGIIWTAPDGLVTTNDIVAAVKKFSLDPDAALLARLDTEGAVPNAVMSSGDILRAVRGFNGNDFGSGVTDCLTGTCVPPQGGACE